MKGATMKRYKIQDILRHIDMRSGPSADVMIHDGSEIATANLLLATMRIN
jgi:hypothetical protein